jgi:hypothetical protein
LFGWMLWPDPDAYDDPPAMRPRAGLVTFSRIDRIRGLMRDVLFDLGQPVKVSNRWRTADVMGVARGIAEDAAFDRLPVLADALMDAGCEEESIIGHCRIDGPHVPGCWVVDRILGKE